MKRLLTGLLFLALAVGAHLAVAAISLADHSSGTEAAGAGGEAHLTLQASDVALVAMVDRWETPVEQPIERLEMPRPEEPVMPVQPRVDLPEIDLAPSQKALPLPVQPPQPTESFAEPKAPITPPPPKPPAPPKKVEAPKAQPAEATQQARAGSERTSSATRAAGSGGGAQAGQAQSAQAAGLSQAARQSALSKWQSMIRSRIERRKRAPRGAGAGSVTLVLTIANSGALQQVSVTKSSGISALDSAALAAVRGARFPQAPKGLTDPVYRFQQTMTFNN
ncbi:energy transducer TonB [Celeribacter sp. PS-C1]|uniref:energy transducer TonB family protein n=1 Tax=Celeribacter sp. PS-C1 TaxID=2820813 RepID=UPI001CA5B5AB|nr:energy transducer TonB [Celeribacter sp. PS-C1]MBW6416458.1 TonB family protein [Celeribacter sp. PS-C1]